MTHGIPTSAGVPASYASETLVAEFNDIGSVERFFEANPGGIAAIIIEPVAGNMGVVPPAAGFLESVRKITQDNGALLIFDEVITGFRVGPNGAQGLYSITPDITTLGKIIGGGLPVGAYGGRKDIMEMVAPLGAMYQAGTLSGNPLAVNAGITTLKELQKTGTYERLETLAQRLTDGLTKAFQAVEMPSTINRVGSMFTGFFNAGPVAGLADAEGSDTEMYGRYFHAMQEQGVYIAPSQFEAGFVSTAHTEADIDAGLFRDIFVAIGERITDEAWAIRLQYKPLVRWLWLGSLFMAAGGFLAIADRRYRIREGADTKVQTDTVAPEPGSATSAGVTS